MTVILSAAKNLVLGAAKNLAAGCVAIFAVVGCAHTATETRVEVTPKLLRWSGLAQTPVAGVFNNYAHVVPPSTVDVFPCSLAVVRVAAADNPTGSAAPPVVLAMSPPNEFIDWVELFDDTWLISEVFLITYPRYSERAVWPNELIEQAREAGAGLCLIYRETVYGASAAEIRGVFYDVRRGTLVATVHAHATAPPSDQVEPAPPPDRVEGDRRHIDPRFVAHDSFRELVRACVLQWVAEHKGPSKRSTAVELAGDRKTRPNTPVILIAD